ncbi:MAG: hypothetical protein JWL73_1837, partial [Actinomycetia bacterium]|nr:hypothetical protein [Actinomycetes bacterium]
GRADLDQAAIRRMFDQLTTVTLAA